jgi:hypothetical protein
MEPGSGGSERDGKRAFGDGVHQQLLAFAAGFDVADETLVTAFFAFLFANRIPAPWNRMELKGVVIVTELFLGTS